MLGPCSAAAGQRWLWRGKYALIHKTKTGWQISSNSPAHQNDQLSQKGEANLDVQGQHKYIKVNSLSGIIQLEYIMEEKLQSRE